MRKIAFIGSRDLTIHSPEVLRLYRESVATAVKHGYVVASGGADGADMLAMTDALRLGGKVHMYSPWPGHKKGWAATAQREHPAQLTVEVYEGLREEHWEWTKSVNLYHPCPEALTPAARNLMARNYGIIAGAAAVVALPKPPEEGGTGQGIRIARALGIKIYNLAVQDGFDILRFRMWERNGRHSG